MGSGVRFWPVMWGTGVIISSSEGSFPLPSSLASLLLLLSRDIQVPLVLLFQQMKASSATTTAATMPTIAPMISPVFLVDRTVEGVLVSDLLVSVIEAVLVRIELTVPTDCSLIPELAPAPDETRSVVSVLEPALDVFVPSSDVLDIL